MKKHLIPLLLILILLLTACGEISVTDGIPGEILVYRLVRPEYQSGSEFIRAEKILYTDEANVVSGAALALKSLPNDGGLMSALPAGVSILSAEKNGRVVNISMSEAYLKLTGIEKTIADSCITLTMCSIPNVDYVSIRAGSAGTAIRFSSEDFLLRNTLINSTDAEIRLYFPKIGSNVLAAEYRRVSISGNISSERMVIDELLRGPTSDKLGAAIPDDKVDLSVYTQDGVCTVSFSEDFLKSLEGDNAAIRLAVYSIVNSLTCLPEVDSVLIIVQNNEDKLLGDIDISEPLTRKTSIIGSAIVE